MNTKKNGVTVPINTAKYRYLTYRMKADVSTKTLFERARDGWVVKMTWWNAGLNTDGTYSQDIVLLEQWRSYTCDMWDNAIINPRYYGSYPQKGWEETPQVTTFMFDPIESTQQIHFWIDDIKICAENEPSNGIYTIAWNVADSDSQSIDIQLYYGYNSALGYKEYGTPICVTQVPPGNGSFVWNMRNIANDDYYIRAVVTDGDHTRSVMSKLPIRVTQSFPRMDVSGDDPTIYADYTGMWKIFYAGQGRMTNVQWGFTSSQAVPGDYNGDGTNDLAVFWDITGRWYVRQIGKSKAILWNYNWGWPGAVPVSGDYDGDGVSDLAIYDSATGNWYVRSIAKNTNLVWKKNWGWPGAMPVPGDYDADGKADFAVLDKNIGYWYIYSPSKKKILLWDFNWGWKGADFVPGDYDGDGASDMTIYRQGDGELVRLLAVQEEDLVLVHRVGVRRSHADVGRFRQRRQDRSHRLQRVDRLLVHQVSPAVDPRSPARGAAPATTPCPATTTGSSRFRPPNRIRPRTVLTRFRNHVYEACGATQGNRVYVVPENPFHRRPSPLPSCFVIPFRHQTIDLLRRLGLLQFIDTLKFLAAVAAAWPSNVRFRRTHPGYALPPSAVAFDAYGYVAWEKYRSSGRAHAQYFAGLIDQLPPVRRSASSNGAAGPGA